MSATLVHSIQGAGRPRQQSREIWATSSQAESWLQTSVVHPLPSSQSAWSVHPPQIPAAAAAAHDKEVPTDASTSTLSKYHVA